jgi:hypothetical protein
VEYDWSSGKLGDHRQEKADTKTYRINSEEPYKAVEKILICTIAARGRHKCEMGFYVKYV